MKWNLCSNCLGLPSTESWWHSSDTSLLLRDCDARGTAVPAAEVKLSPLTELPIYCRALELPWSVFKTRLLFFSLDLMKGHVLLLMCFFFFYIQHPYSLLNNTPPSLTCCLKCSAVTLGGSTHCADPLFLSVKPWLTKGTSRALGRLQLFFLCLKTNPLLKIYCVILWL